MSETIYTQVGADNLPPQSVPPVLPSPPSELEAKYYYNGLYSAHRLVARSSTTPWRVPTNLEAFPSDMLKMIDPVGSHAISEVWENDLGPKVMTLLDSMKVKWITLDIVRIACYGQYHQPVILWIGVLPASLSGHDGVQVAFRCKELLVENAITDVEVEIHESIQGLD